MKKLTLIFATVFLNFSIAGSVYAQSPSTYPSVAAAYAKGKNQYDVVVAEKAGTQAVLYVNDRNPVKATANKQNWATFKKVKLSGSGKISFTEVRKRQNGTKYEQPINYTRSYNASSNKVAFNAPKVQTPVPTPTPTPAPTETPVPPTETAAPTQASINTGVNDTNVSNNNTYTNSDGNTVHSPADSTDGSVPVGATAQCRDGSYSFSQHRSGTCSYHGGVAEWL